jgi:hypothetical protein
LYTLSSEVAIVLSKQQMLQKYRMGILQPAQRDITDDVDILAVI